MVERRKEFRVETKTDALRIFRSVEDVTAFLVNEGVSALRVSWEFDAVGGALVKVPQWADERAQYNEAKARDCVRWGCE